jgi:hypothetical protein
MRGVGTAAASSTGMTTRDTHRSLRRRLSWTLASLCAAAGLAGCAAGGLDEGEPPEGPPGALEDLEDAFVVPDGKADDFLSASAREFVVEGTDTVTIEPDLASAASARKMARVRELISYRHIAIAWFLNQYLVEKDTEESNAGYGGFGGMAKAGSYEDMDIRAVDARTYSFRFRQLVAGRRNLLSLLPARVGADGTRTFTLTVGLPSNAELARLETNAEWYRDAPWSAWNPATVDASRKRDLVLTIRPEVESKDAWLDHARLVADGVLDVDVHFGWDYHGAYHERHARALHDWLVRRGFRAPVSSFAALTRRSGAYTRTMQADGRAVRIEVRIFYGKTGSETDPDTDAGGRALEADMRESLRSRDVIVYSGHSGPFYGFALANWRRTSEGDLDDSEMETVAMPADRYQVVVAEGCDTYMIGAAFGRNPNKPRLRNLDVVTTTSFSNAASPDTVTDFLSHLWEVDARGRHRPRTVKTLLTTLDRNAGIGFQTMYGMHGIDDNPRLHPYAARDMIGQECGANADCGGLGNLCVRRSARDPKFCTAACTDDTGCPGGYACKPVASGSTIYGNACVPR